MNENWTPWKIRSATVGVGILTPEWNLAESSDVEETESRLFTHHVWFEDSFAVPPVISLGLTGFDIDERDSGRISIKARKVTCEGFLVDITSWRGSRVYAVEFSWLAVGA